MNYEYKNKYLWDAPVVWNKPADHFRMLVSLRTRTPWVSDAKLDLEKLINSPIEDFLPYITYGDEMDPALLAYYEGLEKGLKKEMHQRDDFWERWAAFVPLSAYREENRGRKYPLLFVLHGSTMPINWEECSGFTKVAAREEIILCIPEKMEKETVQEIHKILHAMKEPYKEVFSLRVFGELPFAQIGELFGKSDSWARLVFYRAKNELRRQLDE